MTPTPFLEEGLHINFSRFGRDNPSPSCLLQEFETRELDLESGEWVDVVLEYHLYVIGWTVHSPNSEISEYWFEIIGPSGGGHWNTSSTPGGNFRLMESFSSSHRSDPSALSYLASHGVYTARVKATNYADETIDVMRELTC